MKILIIAQYNTFPFEGGNSRFTYIIDQLDTKSNEVEFVTSIFRHSKKEKRNFDLSIIGNLDYKLTLLDEPGYKKNVSLKRIYSHKVLSKNLKKHLNNLTYKPDVIYCAVPSLDFAKEAVKFANKKKIRFIIDIQDIWPEAFRMALNIPIISSIIFFPMKKKADYIYSHSDEIIAVSETYVERALKVNKKVKQGTSVFLGTNLDFFDKCARENKITYKDDLVRIAYIGTLGTSYDIKGVISAIRLLNEKGYKNIRFIVMGDGPLKESFEKFAKENNIDCFFTGRLDYPKMVGLLCSCDIAVNAIIQNATQSIINKVGDYAAAGLPVINTEKCQEYRDLIDKYNAGFNCDNDNVIDMSNKLEKLINNKPLRKSMGKGNRKLAEEKFNREKTYCNIIKLLKGDKL